MNEEIFCGGIEEGRAALSWREIGEGQRSTADCRGIIGVDDVAEIVLVVAVEREIRPVAEARNLCKTRAGRQRHNSQ